MSLFISTYIAYTEQGMIRIATALVALLSIVAAPTASAVCSACCTRPISRQLTICHDKAHARLGPHMHHMDHVHVVAPDSDPSAVVRECDHQLLGSRLTCEGTHCASAAPAHTAFAASPPHPTQLPSCAPAIATSPHTIARPSRSPDICRIAINPALSPSAPLRI